MRQIEILINLEEAPARNISILAERMDAHRSVISRSLKALKTQGIVFRDRHGWHLTQEGLSETAEAKQQLTESTERIRRMADRTTGMIARIGESMLPTISIHPPLLDIASHLPDLSSAYNVNNDLSSVLFPAALEAANIANMGISESLFANLPEIRINPEILGAGLGTGSILNSIEIGLPSFLESTKLTTGMPFHPFELNNLVGNAVAGIDLSDQLVSGIIQDVRNTIEPLLSIQATNQSLLGSLLDNLGSSELFQAANRSNLLLTDMLGDVLDMNNLIPNLSSTTTLGLLSDLTDVNRSLDKVWTSHINADFLPPDVTAFTWQLALPTLTAARYTDSVSAFIHYENDSEKPHAKPVSSQVSEDEKILDRLLAKMDPALVEMRQGARSALSQKGPDYVRHAATSLRELIRQTLQRVAPDDLLPENYEKGKPNIKERVKIALREQGAGKGDADFAATMADATLSLFGRLNKNTHENDYETALVRSFCLSTESTLLLILTLADTDRFTRV